MPDQAMREASGTRESSPPPQTLDVSEKLSAATLAGQRVLVVDDEPDARELLALFLSDVGAEVLTASCAQDAIETVQRFRPHVFVTDIGMPGEDGYSLMKRVTALGPHLGGGIPGIALTAYTSLRDKERALSAGFAAHVAKPVNIYDLIAIMASLRA